MSFWKNLFGGGEPKQAAPEPGEEYKGFTIRPTPMAVGSEFQLSGRIEKEIDGELKTHDFVRADRMIRPLIACADGGMSVRLRPPGVFRVIHQRFDVVVGVDHPARFRP